MFENNTSYDNGAAIYSYSTDGPSTWQTILVEGTAIFYTNESKKSGGAIYGKNLDINTPNGYLLFRENTSHLFGGGAHVEQLQFIGTTYKCINNKCVVAQGAQGVSKPRCE